MDRFLLTGSVRKGRPGQLILAFVCAALLLAGCAGKLERAAKLYYAERPEAALELLKEADQNGGRNRLLYLMEQGLVEHELGEYRASSKSLLLAARELEAFETISASEQLASLATTEWLTKYKGEYSERLWVHSYQMMNFLLLEEFDSAQVEARQALKLFESYPEVLKEDYFTRALMALCFSLVGEDNDAYLIYRKLGDELPSPRPVAADLVRLSARLGQRDEVERFKPHVPTKLPRGGGELVLFVASGRIPQKQPGNVVLPPSIRFSFPYYRSGHSPQTQVRISPATVTLPPLTSDFSALAVTSLAARKARIIVKETARVAGKEAIAQSVGNQFGDAAEVLTRLSLFLLEEPDVRSWQTLPGRLTLVRVPLPAGRHDLTLRVSSAGGFNAREFTLPGFELRSGQKLFHSIRY